MTQETTGQLAADATGALAPAHSPRRILLQRFLRHRLAVVSLFVLVVLAVAALAAPWVEAALGVNAEAVNLFNRMQPPSAAHPLGTDELGRDLLVRLLYGGRVSLAVGLAAALCAAVIGTTLGLIAGTLGGRFDSILMRLADSVIALPLLPLLIVLAAVDLNKLGLPADWLQDESVSIYRIVFLIALVGWTTTARLVRGATLSLREREYVRAAVALGAGKARLMWRHILPNAISPVIVATTRHLAGVGAFLPGSRDSATDAVLGEHADRRAGDHLVAAHAGGLAGPADLHHRDRHKLPGGWLAGRVGSAERQPARLNTRSTSGRGPPAP